MTKHYLNRLLPLIIFLSSVTGAVAQTVISGKVSDGLSGDALPGVNIIVKGKVVGTVTDGVGQFSLTVSDSPPLTLSFSYIGFKTQELAINAGDNTSNIEIKMEEDAIQFGEVVVKGWGADEKVFQSTVQIEKIGIVQVQTTAASTYYEGLKYLPGVDITSSSINFQIINARGFGSTGNTRFVQLTDGMDTQAPALNFPIGNLNGPSELDVESVEMVPGASSALYGPNAFNGILLVTSKNAFDYPGLSAFAKLGVNHIGSNADASPSLMKEGSIRWAKVFKNRFAFKINGSYMSALDWHGTDATDREIGRTPAGLGFNTAPDRLHYMGDEASINLAIFPLSASWRTFASTSSPYYNNVFEPGLTALDYGNAGDLPSHVVSLTPYKEKDLIDYNAKNIKANAGLYYRINDNVEASYLFNGGWGTSIYTGAQRYSLKNFNIMQHRVQLRGDNFFLRGYTTIENSGDSYITEFMAKRVNDLAVNAGNPLFNDLSGYLATYGAQYIRYLYQEGLAPGEVNTLPDTERQQIQVAAHNFARTSVDSQFILDPNSSEFSRIKTLASKGTIPSGPFFKDNTRLYHAEGQYNFKNEISFMELMVGASYKLYDLRSNGTIFDDLKNKITIPEYGAYMMVGKWLGDNKVKLSGSARYDKNVNFKGRLNPRLSVLWSINEKNNIRVSYQTGFRVPSTQGQHIDLSILTARLIGGLPRYADKYNLMRQSDATATNPNQNLSFEGFSVNNYANAVFNSGAKQTDIFNPANISLLKPFTWTPVKPERVQNIEIGYRSMIGDKVMLDLSYYFNLYNDFITQVRARIANQFTTDPAKGALPGYSFNANPALDGTPNYATILNGTAVDIDPQGRIIGNTAQIYTNFTEQVTSQGAVMGLTYNFPKNYMLNANYNWNVLIKQPNQDEFLTEFNTPEHKMNLIFGNRKVTDRLGFNVMYRWQSEFLWQSSFTVPANGNVPAYSTVDAQVSYRIPSMKSIVKLGGSNLLNQKYIQSLGGPNIGAIYYISVTFDEFLK
jgi:outer membrane receptor protein involved in Fe transport